MAIPWLRVLDAVIGLTELARGANRRRPATLDDGRLAGEIAPAGAGGSSLETRFAGVVVAALKEAFERDSQRIQFEREQREADRRRAERLLRLELRRQAAERELARLRLLAALAVAGWLGTVMFAAVAQTSGAARATLGLGWLLLFAAVAAAFVGQAGVSDALARGADDGDAASVPGLPAAGPAGAATPWLLVAGLAVAALAILIR